MPIGQTTMWVDVVFAKVSRQETIKLNYEIRDGILIDDILKI